MEQSASLVSAIIDNALFHSSVHINQMLPHIHILHFCLVELLLQIWCSPSTNLEVHVGDHDFLDYYTLRLEAVNDAQNVGVATTCGKDHDDQQNLSKKR